MEKMTIFEPSMCCSTGVCGPGVDPDLLRLSTVLNNINKRGIVVERFNLTNNPQAFVDNKAINELLNSDGIDILPITILDGKVIKTKAYPTNEEFCKLLSIPEEFLKSKIQMKPKDCGCKGGCC